MTNPVAHPLPVRQTYETPRLVRFGTVRNLTGGSGTAGRDGMVTSSKNNPPGQGG